LNTFYGNTTASLEMTERVVCVVTETYVLCKQCTKYVLHLVVKISLMFTQYFDYYTIILRSRFSWTWCTESAISCGSKISVVYSFVLL